MANAPHLNGSGGSRSAYPDAPWKLRGDLYGTVLKMPAGSIPSALMPKNLKMCRRDGTCLLVAAWVDYQQGSVLTYREFMVAAVLRLRPPLHGTVLRIWVDNPVSQEGGRQLWHIPKDLARFDFTRTEGQNVSTRLLLDDTEAAAYTYRERGRLPARTPFSVVVVQEHSSGIQRTLSTWTARPAIGRGELRVPDDSELAFLQHGRPLAQLALRDFRAVFGRRSTAMALPDNTGREAFGQRGVVAQ